MSLQSCQEWLWQVIQGASNPTGENSFVVAQGLHGIERVGIYARGYRLRLLQCMRAEFSALTMLLGQELFDRFALNYLAEHPSTSYTLHDLGNKFPEFLQHSRPDMQAGASREELFDAMVELTSLERQVFEIYNGEGDEKDVAKGELRPAVSARLVQLSFPLHHYLNSTEEERKSIQLTPARIYLLLSRRNFQVRMEELSATEYRFAQRVLNGELSAVSREILAGAGRDGLQQWQLRNQKLGLLVGELPEIMPGFC